MADVSLITSGQAMGRFETCVSPIAGVATRSPEAHTKGKEVGAKYMPIYEYQCESCGRQFEVIQRMTEPLLAICESCGGHVRRLISQTSFVLKGSGWYVTDYPSESRKKAMAKEKNGGGSQSTASSTTSTASETASKASSGVKD
jgi:putative FmdB family regulatory protein